MCSFYGLKPSEVMALDIETDHILWECITMIEARDLLNQIVVNSFVYMNSNDRENTHRKLYEQAYPDTFKENKVITSEELARLLRGG